MTHFKHFKHLHVPDHWQQYWSKYPQGYTIMEALISWVSQVDLMTDNVNDWNDYLDQFVDTFDTKLQGAVRDMVQQFIDDGTINLIISEALQWELDDYITTNEQDKQDITDSVNQVADSTVNLYDSLTATNNTVDQVIDAVAKTKPIYLEPSIPLNLSFLNEGELLVVWKNILEWNANEWEKGSLASATGLPSEAPNRIRTKNFIPVLPNTDYMTTANAQISSPFPEGYPVMTVLQYAEDDSFIESSGWMSPNTIIKTSPTTTKIKLALQDSLGSEDVSPSDPYDILRPVVARLY